MKHSVIAAILLIGILIAIVLLTYSAFQVPVKEVEIRIDEPNSISTAFPDEISPSADSELQEIPDFNQKT